MRNLARAGLAVTIAVASLGVAPAAFAAYQDGTCSNDEVCAFKDANYGGGLSDMDIDNADFRNDYYTSGGSAHDSVSSGFPLGKPAEFWVNVGYSGAYFILGDSQYDSYWGTNQPNASSSSYNFNDKVDSSIHYVP
jgi:hypothetical protein